jgi:hypothetical protein
MKKPICVLVKIMTSCLSPALHAAQTMILAIGFLFATSADAADRNHLVAQHVSEGTTYFNECVREFKFRISSDEPAVKSYIQDLSANAVKWKFEDQIFRDAIQFYFVGLSNKKESNPNTFSSARKFAIKALYEEFEIWKALTIVYNRNPRDRIDRVLSDRFDRQTLDVIGAAVRLKAIANVKGLSKGSRPEQAKEIANLISELGFPAPSENKNILDYLVSSACAPCTNNVFTPWCRWCPKNERPN